MGLFKMAFYRVRKLLAWVLAVVMLVLLLGATVMVLQGVGVL